MTLGITVRQALLAMCQRDAPLNNAHETNSPYVRYMNTSLQHEHHAGGRKDLRHKAAEAYA